MNRGVPSAHFMASMDMRELGVSGLRKQNGVIYEEFLRELQGPRWYKVLREMQQDPVIGGVLLAIELSLRQVHVEVEPCDDTPAAAEIAEFVEQCLADMSNSWADTLAEILTMLPFGWEYSEVVYKRRLGDSADPAQKSKYNDGRIGWRKWSIRSQDSLDRWEFDKKGGIRGLWQTQDVGAPVLIPIEKALLFRTTANKGNPEGRSLLRSSYSSWYYKSNIQRIEGIGIERDMAGLPVIYAPPEYMSANATADQIAFFELLKTIVINIRRDEQEGVIFPLMYDDKGNKLFELELLTSGGSRQFDTDKVVSRYNQQMTMSMLADFIMLGHEAVGSYALSATKSSLFKTALEAWLYAIADVINTHAVPRLLRLNGMALELAPRVCFGSVGEVDLEDIVQFVKEAATAGMQLFPDMQLENHLRSILGFPMLDEEAYATRETERKADKEADRAAKAKQPVVPNGQQGDGQQGDGDKKMSAADMMAQLEAAQRILARGA